MEPQINNLIQKLIDKTSQGETNWNRIGDTDQFTLTLEKGKISLDNYVSPDEGRVHKFAILNSKGDIISQMWVSENLPEDFYDYRLIDELYDKVRNSYYKVDETIQGLLDETNKKGKIGKSEDTIEDDLLF